MCDMHKLREIRDETDIYIGASENWADTYFIHDAQFKTLLLNKAKLERLFNQYFHRIAPKLINKIKWDKYEKITADETEQEWITNTDFDTAISADSDDLQLLLVDVITAIAIAGILSSKEDAPKEVQALKTKLNQMGNKDLSVYIEETSRSYSADLVTKIDDVTRQRINTTVTNGFNTGQSIEELKKSLLDVIDNPKRAGLIAHTESVNAYSKGRRDYATDSGATTHTWETQSRKPCPLCIACANAGEIPINEPFANGWYSPADAHPDDYCVVIYHYNVD